MAARFFDTFPGLAEVRRVWINSQEITMNHVFETVAVLRGKDGEDDKILDPTPRLQLATSEDGARLRAMQQLAKERTEIDADRVSIFVRQFRG